MKKILSYIITICSVLYGCSDDYKDGQGLYATLTPHFLKATPASLTVPADESTESINVTSVKTSWKIENSVDWLNISTEHGTSSSAIQIKSSENTSVEQPRVGIFFLKSDDTDWEYKVPISVTQATAKPLIQLSKSEIELTGSVNTETIAVTTNCKYTAESSESWLSITQKNNGIEITSAANETETNRTAMVVLSCQNTTAVLTVRQIPAAIDASYEQLEFDNTAGSTEVNINSESTWTASSSDSWIDVQPINGKSGTSSVVVSVLPNASAKERIGYVYLLIGNNRRMQIPVKQKGCYIEPEKTDLYFPSTASNIDFKVKSNTDWHFTSCPSWIRFSAESGGNAVVTITVLDNPSTDERTGSFHIVNTNLGIDIEISVVQAGKTFDVNTSILNFDDKESMQTVDINTDGAWSASTNNDWIIVEPMSSIGLQELVVSVKENTGDSERTGQIVVTMGDKTATIQVIQKGKFFTVSDEMLSFASIGGSIKMSITTNDTWTAKIEGSPSWLKLSKTSGAGNIDITATASDNPTTESRNATIIFETKYSQNIKVVVTQEALQFSIDTYELTFYGKGGSSESVTISTNRQYKITVSDTWLSVKQTGNTFTVTASENTTPTPRTGTISFVLTDLTVGEMSYSIDVLQFNNGSSILRYEYGEDIDYDQYAKSFGNIRILKLKHE